MPSRSSSKMKPGRLYVWYTGKGMWWVDWLDSDPSSSIPSSLRCKLIFNWDDVKTFVWDKLKEHGR